MTQRRENGPSQATGAASRTTVETHPKPTGTPSQAHLVACPHWCDQAHDDYSPRAAQSSGEVLHWRAIRADWDPSLELAHVTKRNRWTSDGFLSTRPGRLRLRLTPHWADADLDGPAGDELATTIERGRQLIARLNGGGAR